MLQGWRHRRRCGRLARVCKQPVLGHYLETCAHLAIDRLDNTPLIAVDFELTGLDKNIDHIVAMGWTWIDRGRIQMSSNRHLLISTERSVGSSAAIHELLDSEIAQGGSIEEGLESLFDAAQGRVWVFHHARLDIALLRSACSAWAGVVPRFAVLDTMRIAYSQRKRREQPIRQGDLQLNELRRPYGLPQYTAHNALNDAIATAELTLAIASRMEPDNSLRLAPHIKYM